MNVRLVATKFRRLNRDDQAFIERHISQLHSDNIIELCYSPWRAQLVAVKDLTNKRNKRLCVDYYQTVNIYTQLDAYPMPRIDDINSLAKYKLFSTFDLKSPNRQMAINDIHRLKSFNSGYN